MREIRAEVEIQASAERVWQVLTTFAEFPEWNPYLRVTGGSASVGERLVVTVSTPGSPTTTYRSIVETAQPPHELQWIGRLGVPGLIDGRYRFEIAPLSPGRVRLVQTERFRGLFVAVAFYFGMGDATHRGFEQMNDALRRRAESQSSPPSPST